MGTLLMFAGEADVVSPGPARVCLRSPPRLPWALTTTIASAIPPRVQSRLAYRMPEHSVRRCSAGNWSYARS